MGHYAYAFVSVDELSQAARAQAFLGSVRVLNLLTGVTEANSWWTTDRSSHTAYALGQSKLAFIAFMLSRFEMTRTVPRIQVDGLLRGDFAECYVSGQLAHAHCLDILCMALDRLNRKWTYTGIALNFFDRPLVGPAQMPTRAMPTNSNSAGTWEMSDAERLAEYSELGLLSSCPFGIPEPPVLGSSCQEQNAKGGATCDKRQLGSSFLRLPDECLNAVIRYLGEREFILGLLSTIACSMSNSKVSLCDYEPLQRCLKENGGDRNKCLKEWTEFQQACQQRKYESAI
ncbi:hypothetical protein GGI07_002117 [Coemansia sp. Benny D115]|nr:hypothetical protein GGI07_002117 [Coemansia sp. Benny D115]